MIRQDAHRIDPKRRATIDYKKRQFAAPTYKQQDYPFRLNLYDTPPTAEITLEQFEQWAIDRLRILAEIEACSYRNKNAEETSAHITPLLQKFLPLSSNTSGGPQGAADPRLKHERQKDHYSHFILRLAFSATEDLRRRFARAETMLFRFRFQKDDSRERRAFVDSLSLDWEPVSDEERAEVADHLIGSTPGLRRVEDETWYKVDWEKVPELVERRSVYLRRGQAYVPGREQLSMIMAEFTARLERSLELTSRALPRLDEDDRLTPILNHLSKNFGSADSVYSEGEGHVDGTTITAASIDQLSQFFPLCMRNLHVNLRKNNHLKHFGRLQYTLFLKGIGLSLEECILFWRQSFKGKTDDEFNSQYKYNIRHAYGEVGGDVNRRGRGYPPYSCQKILSDNNVGVGQSHGCPYRHYSVDNLVGLLQSTGVHDKETLRGVRDDVGKQRYHIACNRVFEWSNKAEIKKVKEDGTWTAADLDTIVHPNTYFKRGYLLKQLAKAPPRGE